MNILFLQSVVKFQFLHLRISKGITSSAVGLKMCAITAGIRKYMSIIKKKRKQHNHIVLLSKAKLNTIEILMSKASINEFVSRVKIK